MALIVTTIGISPTMYEKCLEFGINRSKLCRDAINVEIARIEKEIGGTRRQAMQPPTTTPIKEGEEFVIG